MRGRHSSEAGPGAINNDSPIFDLRGSRYDWKFSPADGHGVRFPITFVKRVSGFSSDDDRSGWRLDKERRSAELVKERAFAD